MDLRSLVYIIPARMESSRFPGKPLVKLRDKPVVEWVYRNCVESKYCDKAIIATDSQEIANYCADQKMNVVMTGSHNCASDRVAEVCKTLNDSWVVEVQGDEPLLWPVLMDTWLEKCGVMLGHPDSARFDLFISVAKLRADLADDPNYVKIIKNSDDELVMVSRSRIPNNQKKPFDGIYFRHTGFHLWRRSSLVKFGSFAPSDSERAEDTHAVRMIEHRLVARAVELDDTQAIDNPDDIDRASAIVEGLSQRV